jgi:hypothetical protein
MYEQVIYLKALVNKQPKFTDTHEFKMKVKSLAKDIYLDVIPKSTEQDDEEGRKFILNNIHNFLEYAVEYSLADKFNDFFFYSEK